jgi:hypothetical protein
MSWAHIRDQLAERITNMCMLMLLDYGMIRQRLFISAISFSAKVIWAKLLRQKAFRQKAFRQISFKKTKNTKPYI